MSNIKKLHVEVWSDIVCPFCYISERETTKSALSTFKQSNDVELEFRSFQLEPDFIQDTTNKYNLTEALAKNTDVLLLKLKKCNNKLQKRKVRRLILISILLFGLTPNAHRIIQIAKEKRIGNQLIERFFSLFYAR